MLFGMIFRFSVKASLPSSSSPTLCFLWLRCMAEEGTGAVEVGAEDCESLRELSGRMGRESGRGRLQGWRGGKGDGGSMVKGSNPACGGGRV